MASRTSSASSVPPARRLLWPALTTGAMLAIALGLGSWQIQRLHWKEGLLAEIDRAETAPPVPLPASPAPFEKVEATGILRADQVARYGSEVRTARAEPELGSQVVVPLERPGRPPLLVDLGWLPDRVAPSLPAGPARVTGYVRPPETGGPFAPGPDLAQRRFWSLDPAAIGAALGLPAVEPYTLVVLGPADAVPAPAQRLPRPRNDHLGYALTWFGLAACLLAIFSVYVVRTFRA